MADLDGSGLDGLGLDALGEAETARLVESGTVGWSRPIRWWPKRATRRPPRRSGARCTRRSPSWPATWRSGPVTWLCRRRRETTRWPRRSTTRRTRRPSGVRTTRRSTWPGSRSTTPPPTTPSGGPGSSCWGSALPHGRHSAAVETLERVRAGAVDRLTTARALCLLARVEWETGTAEEGATWSARASPCSSRAIHPSCWPSSTRRWRVCCSTTCRPARPTARRPSRCCPRCPIPIRGCSLRRWSRRRRPTS